MSSSLTSSTEKARKVLVYLFGSLGDSLIAIPALRAVRRHFSNAEIVLLQNFHAGHIVVASDVIPSRLVDRYLSYETNKGRIGRLAGFLTLWLKLRRERFDAAVYLVISERSERSVVRDRRFFSGCGIGDLIGFNSFSSKDLFPKDRDGRPAPTVHEAVRRLERLNRDGLSSEPGDLEVPLLDHSQAELKMVDDWLNERRTRPSGILISLGPGYKTKANVWPLENFTRIGSHILSETNAEIVVVGGPQEQEMGEKLISAWGSGINAAGTFSVKESGALLSRCGLHIGLDTGTTHLAALAGTRCFAIYGERDNPGRWFPLGSGHTIVFHKTDCAGCQFRECPVPGHPCMNGISVEAVWAELQKFIREPPIEETRVIAV